MKKKIHLAASIAMYSLAILLMGYYFALEFNKNFTMLPGNRVGVLLFICLFMYFGGRMLSKYAVGNKEKIYRINLFIWFILYIILLSTLTLFDSYFHRNILNFFNWSSEIFKNYTTHSLNLVPFSTISYYIINFAGGSISYPIFWFNIVGNLAALTPFAFFLPMLFKKQENFKNFAAAILMIVISIELLQFITLSGTCDIDDVILNSAGAYIVFGILHIKPIKTLIRNIFLPGCSE